MSGERFNIGQKVTGKVVGFNHPYFDVVVGDTLGRLYVKNMDMKFLTQEEIKEMINRELEFKIEKILKSTNKTHLILILNRRILIEESVKKIVDVLNIEDIIFIDEVTINKGGVNFSYNNIRGFVPLKEISYKYYATSKAAVKELKFPIGVKIISIDQVKGAYNIVGSIRASKISPLEKLNGLDIGDIIEVNELVANKGGVNFTYNESQGFVPLKEISHDFIQDVNIELDKIIYPIKIKITRIENKGSYANIIGSIRANIMTREEVISTLNIGDKIIGEELTTNKGGLNFKYKNIRGFIPISEISHEFYANSEEAFKDIIYPVTITIMAINDNNGQYNIIGSIKNNLEYILS